MGISIYGQFVLVPFSSNVSCDKLSRIGSVFGSSPHLQFVCHQHWRGHVLSPAKGCEAGFTVRKFNTSKPQHPHIYNETESFCIVKEARNGILSFLACSPLLYIQKASLYSIKKRRVQCTVQSAEKFAIHEVHK